MTIRQRTLLPVLLGAFAAVPSHAQNRGMPNATNVRYIPAQAAYYPTQPQAPQPYVDYRRAPVMDDSTYTSLRGYRTPNRYNFQPATPKMVYAPNGLAMPESALEQERDNPNVKYFMALSAGQTAFGGSAPSTNFIEYPMNNNPNASMGNGSQVTFSLGAISRGGWRGEVFFTNLSGLGYGKGGGIYAKSQSDPESVWELDDYAFDMTETDPYLEGGAVVSQGIGASIYMPMSDVIGTILDGFVSPYVGVGFGVSYNKISDYATYDEFGYAEAPWGSLVYDEDDNPNEGFYEYDGWITHYGASTRSNMFHIEAGVEVKISPKTSLDFYFRQWDMGEIKSHDIIETDYANVSTLFPSEDEIDPVDGMPLCETDAEDEGFWYNEDTGFCEVENDRTISYVTGAGESGRIRNQELGVRLRVVF
ncbi:MAG: hypothetical protein LBH41_00160 [Rickettsiales bacterium]|jgi:hypothetical protein|nr:hypothetical protein [Rickettsiales bacterium]